MSWNTRSALLLLVLVAGCAGMLFGATQNAVIYGTVYNAGGNPMPDVTVLLENRALGFARTTTTGSDGSYNFAEVPPADGYTVTAKQGAKVLDMRPGVTVNVGDERVILPPLTEQVVVATPGPAGPGAVKPKPTAVAGGPTVRPDYPSTMVSGVVTGEQLRSLPLYNRNFLVLGLITPNAHDTEPSSPLAGASFSVSGGRPTQNNFLLDGSDNLASSSNQAIPFQVNDSIQEFRVISGTANAEYGRNLAGTINVVTKRASNSFHGSAYGYFANDALNAGNPLSVYNNTTFRQAAGYAGSTSATAIPTSNFITNPEAVSPFSYNQYVANAEARGYCTDSITPGFALANAADTCAGSGFGANNRFDPDRILSTHDQFKDPFDSKQFGASAGGALIKDKWFAFGSYEGTRIDNPNPILERVPSSLDKTFQGGVTGNGYMFASGLGATDPNFVLGQNVLSLFPASNISSAADGAVPGVLEFYQGQAPNYTHVHNFLFRTDYVKSDKSSFSLRYVAQFLNQLHDDTLPESSVYPGNGAFRKAVNQNISVAYSHTFSPSTINELRLGFSRFDIGESAQDAGFDATSIGLPFHDMPTILLSGIDTQSSGAVPSVLAAAPAANGTFGLGAFATWLDFTDPTVVANTATMLPWADGRFPMARLGAPLGAPSERRDSTYSIADNLSWTHGRHSFKFGGEFRHLDNDLFNGALARGLVYSSNIGEFTSDSESCNWDYFFAGACMTNAFNWPTFDFAQFNPTYSGKFSSFVIAGYFQDTFRIRKNITLNYGVRYEYFSVPNEINDNIWNFDPGANGMVQQNGTAIVDPYGNVCGASNPRLGYLTGENVDFIELFFPGGSQTENWATSAQPGYSFAGCGATSTYRYNQIGNSNRRNFAPRVGLAWNVRGDEVRRPTVIRFGVGMFYDQAPISSVSQLLYNRPMATPNHIKGLDFIGSDFFISQICGGASSQCGIGSTIIDPAEQTATTFDGVNPNSYYTNIQQPFSVYARDTRNSGTPWAWQTSLTVQQQLTPKVTLEVGYVGVFSKWLPAVYDQNYAAEWGHVRTLSAGPAESSLLTDNMSNTPVFTMTNRGESNYSSLMTRVRLAGWHGLRLNATYNWSRSMDNSSTGIFPNLPISPRGSLLADQYLSNASYPTFNLLGIPIPTVVIPGAQAVPPVFPSIDFSTGALTTTGARPVLVSGYNIPQDPFNFLTNDWGRSDFDSKHRLTIDYVWETKSTSRWLDMWSFSGIFTAQSGQPFSIFAGPIAGAINQRAELGVPPGQVVITDNPFGAIDPTQFIFQLGTIVCPTVVVDNNASTFMPIPGQACTGRSGRNAFIGPNYINMNVAVQKGFTVAGEDKKLYLRAEFFNLFNRENLYNPISSIGDNGVAPSSNFGRILSSHDPRQIQFAVRFSW